MARRKRTTRNRTSKSFFRNKLLWIIPLVLIIGYYFGKDLSIGYYDKANGLKGEALKTALHNIIRKHEVLNFDQNISGSYWWNNYFSKTDWHPDGYYWDMYSNDKNKIYIGGDKQNREHLMPRSWWGQRKTYHLYDANGDLHNLYPAENNVNAAKSNLSLGEVGTTKFDNGVSKIGLNTYPNGYRGQVFEPASEYKGDFARVFFYMVTCYEDYAYTWREEATKTMIEKGTYPGLKPWAIDMLLKWHRDDPVSNKEVNRNEEVYKIQGNRNPFIDCPELPEYIWGSKKDSIFIAVNKKINRQPEVEEWLLFSFQQMQNFLTRYLNEV